MEQKFIHGIATHCMKSVRIRSYFGRHFPAFRPNNCKYGYFLRSDRGKTAKVFLMQIVKNMLCNESQWSCETQNRILHEELKKQIIKSKVKADVDHVNHYFSNKHLYAMTKMTNVPRNLEPNII